MEDYCPDCGEKENMCSCYFYFEGGEDSNPDFKFEYAFESITQKSSIFKRNLSEN